MSTHEQHGRGIILLHDIFPSTAAAVPALLKALKAKGYKVVHLRPAATVQTLAGFDPPLKPAKEVTHGERTRRVRIHARSGSPTKWLTW
jgi:hypothetical protein